MLYSEVCRQLQYDEAIPVDTETDAENGAAPPQPKEKLIVKLPLAKGKAKGKKKTGEPSKTQTKGGGVNKCGGGCSNCGRGHGHGQSNGTNTSTSSSNDNNSPGNITTSRRGCRGGRSRGQKTDNVTDASYPVPDYKAVVVEKTANTNTGYTPPENALAKELAKYFESRTEIEYEVLLEKMATVPEADMMQILGIKKKSNDNDANDAEAKQHNETEHDKSIEELNPDDEKEAEAFMASLAQAGKEKKLKREDKENKTQRKAEEKAKEDKNKKTKKEKDTTEPKKQTEKNTAEKEKEKEEKLKRASPIKPCSVQMGNKVPNKSPVKVFSDNDSDVVIISSDNEAKKEGKEKTKQNEGPLNLSMTKKEESETDDGGSSSHGVYFSDSDTFRNAINLSKKNSGNETDGSSSHGIYYSDSDEFRKAVDLSKKHNQIDNKDTNDNNAEIDESSSNGVYFSDSDDFKRAVEMSKQSNTDDRKDGNTEIKGKEDDAVTGNNTNEKGDESEDDGTSSKGVYFSDSEEFAEVKQLSKQGKKSETDGSASESVDEETDGGASDSVDKENKEQLKNAVKLSLEGMKENGSGMESDVTSSSGGFYFSDPEEFKRAKQMAMANNDSDNTPLFEKDTDSVPSDIDEKKVKVVVLQKKEEQKCKKTENEAFEKQIDETKENKDTAKDTTDKRDGEQDGNLDRQTEVVEKEQEQEQKDIEKEEDKDGEKKQEKTRTNDNEVTVGGEAVHETDGASKTKESELISEKTSEDEAQDDTDFVTKGQLETQQDESLEEGENQGEGNCDDTDTEMKEDMLGNENNAEEDEEQDMELDQNQVYEEQDLETLMQDDKEEMETNADADGNDNTDGESGSGAGSPRSSRSYTSEYSGTDGIDDDGRSLRSVSYKSSASASGSGNDTDR